MNRDKINLIIIDNSSLFWEGFRHLLEKEPTIHLEQVTNNEAVFTHELQKNSQRVALVSGEMLQAYKSYFQQMIKGYHLKVIAISERSEDYMVDALEVGATGYLLKDMNYDDFIEAIRTVAQGKYWFHPYIAGPIIKKYVSFMPRMKEQTYMSIEHNFTKREFDVLNLLAKGYSNKKIADALQVTSFTVSSHIRNILKKSAANDRTEAVVKAIENGWITIERKQQKDEILDEI